MEGSAGREELYLAYESSIRGLLKGSFKLVECATPLYRNTQLFNLDEDPDECCDLSRNPSHGEMLARMRTRLHELAVSTGDRQHCIGRTYWENYA